VGEARAERSLVGEYGAMSTRQSIRYELDDDTGYGFHIFQDAFDLERNVYLEFHGVQIDSLATYGKVSVTVEIPLPMAIKLGLMAGRELKPPYPFCRTPEKCAGQGYCKRDPACNE
jgi:hypothetical protein